MIRKQLREESGTTKILYSRTRLNPKVKPEYQKAMNRFLELERQERLTSLAIRSHKKFLAATTKKGK